MKHYKPLFYVCGQQPKILILCKAVSGYIDLRDGYSYFCIKVARDAVCSQIQGTLPYVSPALIREALRKLIYAELKRLKTFKVLTGKERMKKSLNLKSLN